MTFMLLNMFASEISSDKKKKINIHPIQGMKNFYPMSPQIPHPQIFPTHTYLKKKEKGFHTQYHRSHCNLHKTHFTNYFTFIMVLQIQYSILKMHSIYQYDVD